MRPLLISVFLAASSHALPAQTAAPGVDVQLAAIEHVLADLVPESSFCIRPPRDAYSYRLPRDTTDLLAPPSNAESDRLRDAASNRFGRHALPYCILRPKAGFEPELARLHRRPSIGGPTRWWVGPYGQRAVLIGISQPRMLASDRAQVGFTVTRGNGFDSRRCEFRLADSRWTLVGECEGFNLRA